MHPDTQKTMTWILRAGGQVTAPLLAYWRFTYGGGDREARRRLNTFESRNWMKRHGSERYPLFTLTTEGLGMCALAGIEVSPEISRTPKITARHDASTAAILQRAVDLGVLADWHSRCEFSRSEQSIKLQQKEPDALAQVRMKNGTTELFAVELEASKKGGSLRKGHSNWASTARNAARLLGEPVKIWLDGEIREIHNTLYIALSDTLAKGMHAKAVAAYTEIMADNVKPIWLIGNRLRMTLSNEPRGVSLDLLEKPKPEQEVIADL